MFKVGILVEVGHQTVDFARSGMNEKNWSAREVRIAYRVLLRRWGRTNGILASVKDLFVLLRDEPTVEDEGRHGGIQRP